MDEVGPRKGVRSPSRYEDCRLVSTSSANARLLQQVFIAIDLACRDEPKPMRRRAVPPLPCWMAPERCARAQSEWHPIDISKDEQFKPDFLKVSPNNRIPAIVDRENSISLMEFGAILIYLADKTGKLFPKSGERHYRVLEWLMWQMGGPGPMFGQVHHFVKYNKGKAPYAEERYLKCGR
jgi:hypothetical protein